MSFEHWLFRPTSPPPRPRHSHYLKSNMTDYQLNRLLWKISGAKPMPVKITMRSSKDVPKFLKKFDAVQRRTRRNSLKLT